MRFRITSQLNDGLAEAPDAITEEVLTLAEIWSAIREEFANDEGEYLPVGAKVTIERVS